jgi:hypothetical protein
VSAFAEIVKSSHSLCDSGWKLFIKVHTAAAAEIMIQRLNSNAPHANGYKYANNPLAHLYSAHSIELR